MTMPARTRTVVFYSVAIPFLSLLQVSLPDHFLGLAGKPDLALVLTILAGFLYGPFEGGVVGLACGFFRDTFSGGTIGAGMLLCMYAGVLSAILFHRTFRRSFLAGVLQVLMVSTITYLSIGIVAMILDPLRGSLSIADWAALFFRKQLPPVLALDGAAALPLLLLLRYAGPRRRPQPGFGHEGIVQEGWHLP